MLVTGFLAGVISSGASAQPSLSSASAGLGRHGLEQVALTSADLPRAVVFYRDVLGLPFLFESNGMAFFDMAVERGRSTGLRPGVIVRRPSGATKVSIR